MLQYHMMADGRVQGVGFRYFVQMEADRHKIAGWVKNRADGTVEILAEGEEDKLKKFLLKVREGPSFGHVSRLDKEWLEPSNKYRDFQIVF